jgi:hypothetical protein
VPIKKHGRAAGMATGLDVAPPVPDDEALRQVGAPVSRQEARERLATPTLAIVVVTDTDFVNGQHGGETSMDGLDAFARLQAARDVGLVRDDDEPESGRAECGERLARVRINCQVRETTRRVRPAVLQNRAVQYAVAIEEDRALKG